MVCLYGTTLDLVEKKLTVNEKKEYPVWSWFVFQLTDYIYHLDPQRAGTAPRIPSAKEDTIYSQWFRKLIIKLKKTFNDATHKIVFRCLENTPAEEVAIIVFEATESKLLNEFRENLSPSVADMPLPFCNTIY